MYITVKSIKRNLGFKGIEISDIVITAFPAFIAPPVASKPPPIAVPAPIVAPIPAIFP